MAQRYYEARHRRAARVAEQSAADADRFKRQSEKFFKRIKGRGAIFEIAPIARQCRRRAPPHGAAGDTGGAVAARSPRIFINKRECARDR
ncbi:hypothetical protein [Paracoccus cavernae]|uniref:hypothetical protein n=1 Tax=Paracoccus cavernae TaxID=1571207 RepID=UPI003633B05B